MVTITDFIILNKKLEKYYKLLCDITGYDDSKVMSPVNMMRFGFYLYILENVCDIESNNDDIIDAIIDTEFNKEFFNDVINLSFV
ncbi:hypothetical protein [Xenorhabdus sp. Sc-CR9]|uniref:hypothetical protein n=1 Tax=Xenorhabdus sp. Sc-CR9 TaxID=2584468 RepID=UPI001F3F8198|nr:hypothetical protein [Xenorhabdus sp. Sc-CR9]